MVKVPEIKLTARIPIVPDDINHKQEHIEKEIVMDFDGENDIYILNNGKYINITGKIKDSIGQIQDGSTVFHIVTEDSLPLIADRKKNHWYIVITSAEDYVTKDGINTHNYIYYGVVNDEYYQNKNYILMAQNVISNSSTVKMKVPRGYKACFYVPANMEPIFTDSSTTKKIEFEIQERLYCMTPSGETMAYDVYMSKFDNLGNVNIKVEFTGANWHIITFDVNISNIQGFKLNEESRKVQDGIAIGNIPNPTWTEARYIFKGWSIDNMSEKLIDPSTWKPDKNIKLYAYFEYDNDLSKYTYHAIYRSSKAGIIGEFYSVAPKNTQIKAKEFIGYITPTDPIKLTVEAQEMEFLYEPIEYDIIYAYDSGVPESEPKKKYTVEDTYTPPVCNKDGYTFRGWEPAMINPGTTGPITMTATYSLNAILKTGLQVRDLLSTLSSDFANDIMNINYADVIDEGYNTINLSSNSSKVIAWYYRSTKTLKIHSDEEIYFNNDSSEMFMNFTNLRSIIGLERFRIKPDTNIQNMFSGCTGLSDLSILDSWNLTGKNFNGAFDGTMALSAGRTPAWYVFIYTVNHISVTGKHISTERLFKIPGYTFYESEFDGYVADEHKEYKLELNNQKFTIKYRPIERSIEYILGEGGELAKGTKSTLTIEDTSYTPPTPSRNGYDFVKWVPASININNLIITAEWKVKVWNYHVEYLSITDKHSVHDPKDGTQNAITKIEYIDIEGYDKPETPEEILDEDNKRVSYLYTLHKYNINYNLNSGLFTGESVKNMYTIEDETYIPPEPVRDGFIFAGWTPTNLPKGTTGDFNFTANWNHE